MSRRGLSRIEVLVLLVIVAVLAALVLPAVSAKRGPRRMECLNNIKNVGLSHYNYASTNGGKLLPLEDGEHGWPVRLLAQLDRPDLARRVAAGKPLGDDVTVLKVFTCPQDGDSFRAPGGLSYVVNAGFGRFRFDAKAGRVVEGGTHSPSQDWDGDGAVSKDERRLTRATGVLWRPDDELGPLTLNDIGLGDGIGSTLLLAESLHAGPWTSRTTGSLGFVVGRDRLSFDAARGPLAVTRADLGPFAPDSGVVAPAPSANHPGGFNAAFCDGRAQSLSSRIDPLVYVRLMTWAGSRYGEPALKGEEF